MRLSKPSPNPSARIPALILILATLCFGQATGKPPQSVPAKKTQPAVPEPQSNNQEQHDQHDQAIKLEATLVTVPVIAMDRDGKYIPDMRREDFTIHEDGTKQEIVFFGTVNEPFHVVLMLDTSASTLDKLGQIKRAAATFIEQLKPADRLKVIAFDDQVRDLCEFTNDRVELARAVDRTQPGQGTKLYDAVALALRELRPIQGRKAIVLFTDGADRTSDTARYNDNINAVEESGVIVYPIRYNTRAETEAMLRNQSGIIKRPPVGTTPTTVPGGDRPQLPPLGGPTTRDPRIPPVGPPPGPSPRNTPNPGSRIPDDRLPDSRFRRIVLLTAAVLIQDPGRGDSLSRDLDAVYALADHY